MDYKPRYGFDGPTLDCLMRSYWVGGKKLKGQGWYSFDAFVLWCSFSGYQKGYHLRRLNPDEPHGPENSYWEPPVRGPVTEEPDENPCDTCNYTKQCGKACPRRAAWWDVKMQEIRRALGVKRA